ncbi:MAG: hypothetical protein JO182_22330, partial [Acidobacteriaceae bacterium]|nr:hypothetical protein [Acidobacteriaceae bacterium]
MSTQPQAIPLPNTGARKFSLPNISQLGVPIAVLAIVVALITPLPSVILDFLIVIDIMMSVIV